VSVLALTHLKGGVGKTTTAINVAFLAAQQGPTLLWDLDPQGASSFLLRVKPSTPHGAGRLLRDDEALQASIVGTDHEGLELLPADFSCRKLDALLARSDARGRGLSRALGPLRLQYKHILLDGPAGISFLAENLYEAADGLLLPTPPVPLALRALARLARHVARRRGPTARLLPFLSQLDRRKAVHAAVAEWAEAHEGLVLRAAIPQAVLIEEMSVRRAPLGAYASGSVPALAYETLWAEVQQRLRAVPIDGRELAEAIEALLRALEALAAAPVAAPAAAPAPRPHADGREVEIKAALSGESAATALLAALPPGSPAPGPAREQLNHLFDTPRGALRAAGLALRLREEGGHFTLTAKGPSAANGDAAVADRPEEEVTLDAGWAYDLLGGRRSPLDVLRTRLAPARPALLDALEAAAGNKHLQRAASFRNVRRRVGPVRLAAGEAEPVELVLELDRTEFPDGRIEHEVEAEVPPEKAGDAQRALEQLFAQAGLPWAPATSKMERLFAKRR
jgi:chromosome partitioning protein